MLPGQTFKLTSGVQLTDTGQHHSPHRNHIQKAMIKRALVDTANSFLHPFGAHIIKLGHLPAPTAPISERRDPSTCSMEHPALQRMLTDELAQVASNFFSQHLAD